MGFALIIGTLLFGPVACAQIPFTQPGWNSDYFKYDQPRHWAIEESTPTADQLNWQTRPAQTSATAAAPRPTTTPAQPARVGEMNVIHLRFKDADGDIVPALLCEPDGDGPFPVVVAVHALSSNKAQVCAQIAPALVGRGFAVLAPDLPMHGERPGLPHQLIANSDASQRFNMYRRAIVDVRLCIDLAEKRPELETKNGVVLAGYSLGSWIDAVVGPADDRVKEMVLMVGGAWDIAPAWLLIPQVASVDPRLSMPHFAGRPLLMLSARQDQIVTPDMSRRLFAAAQYPKKQLWYDSGHLLPSQAYDDAGQWIADTWAQLAAGRSVVSSN